MVPVPGVLESKDTGSSRRTGRGDKERVSPPMSMTIISLFSIKWFVFY